MFNLLLAAQLSLWTVDLWYAIPAIIAVSLVYAATRHEQMRPILYHAGRVAVWITGFMVAISVVIQFVSMLIKS
jgi:hypothetical protein